MAFDEVLAARIRDAFRGRRDITERRMFGGLSFMYRQRMCCGVVGSELVVRVAAEEFAAVLRRKHVRPMDFTGKPLKGFVYVSAAGWRTSSALRRGSNAESDSCGWHQPRRRDGPVGGTKRRPQAHLPTVRADATRRLFMGLRAEPSGPRDLSGWLAGSPPP